MNMLRLLVAALTTLALACGGGGGPDGSCIDDFDCAADQVCGRGGYCLLCQNCDRGRVGSCTVPLFPLSAAPDAVRLETGRERDSLFYVYLCPGNVTEFRYDRLTGQRCFEPVARVDDGCGLW